MGNLSSSRDLLRQAAGYAAEYLDGLAHMPAFPTDASLAALHAFDEPLPAEGAEAAAVIEQLHRLASPATTAQRGGRYFGFVNGGMLPAAQAAAWLADAWNQNAALALMSPAVAKLEQVCEGWIVELLDLPRETAMGVVTGSANALVCALAAARNELLRRQGYDIRERGLRNAPKIRVVLGAGAHATVKTALTVLGFGAAELEIVPTDDMSRMRPDALPALDAGTLLILQAGHVCGGGFDAFAELCPKAKAAGAWVHIDGAFGLWAACSPKYRHLTRGVELADSWVCDAHKTLNAGYDCGLVLCRDREALTGAWRRAEPISRTTGRAATGCATPRKCHAGRGACRSGPRSSTWAKAARRRSSSGSAVLRNTSPPNWNAPDSRW